MAKRLQNHVTIPHATCCRDPRTNGQEVSGALGRPAATPSTHNDKGMFIVASLFHQHTDKQFMTKVRVQNGPNYRGIAFAFPSALLAIDTSHPEKTRPTSPTTGHRKEQMRIARTGIMHSPRFASGTPAILRGPFLFMVPFLRDPRQKLSKTRSSQTPEGNGMLMQSSMSWATSSPQDG